MADYDMYDRYISELRVYAKVKGVTDNELKEIFRECYSEMEKQLSWKYSRQLLSVIKFIFVISTAITIALVALYSHPYTHNLFLRNMQHLIYPGLNVFRKIAVPVITKYPALTEFYDEWCLIDNPHFQVSEMDCWPCTAVESVADMTGCSISKNINVGIPFTRHENDSAADMRVVAAIINDKDHRNIFIEDAGRVTSTNTSYRTIEDVMNRGLDETPSPSQNTHISWRINRMRPSRILRKIFPRPANMPQSWGQSTERFLFIDEPNAPAYEMPNPECSNVILRCTSGSRLIKINPSPECLQNCKTLTIVLSAGYTLWYNWWYWRPASLPVPNSTNISIHYLSSFC